MLLSSGVIWRHRELDDFLRECPGGNPKLQRLVYEDLDDDLAWLEQRGARVVERATGNPRTTGVRFDTRSLTEALTRHAGELRLADAAPRASRARPDRPRDRRLPGKPGARAGVDHPRGRRAASSARRRGVSATASRSAERPGRARPPGWTSSTDGTCRRRRPTSRRRSSSRSPQLYAQHAVVEDAEGEQYDRNLVRDRRRPVDSAQAGRARDIPDPRGAPRRAHPRAHDRRDGDGRRTRRGAGQPHSGVGARRRRRGDHDDARRPSANTDARVAPGVYAAGLRRRRDLDRRLLERPRRGPRPRADRRSVGAGELDDVPVRLGVHGRDRGGALPRRGRDACARLRDGRGPRRDAGRPAGRGPRRLRGADRVALTARRVRRGGCGVTGACARCGERRGCDAARRGPPSGRPLRRRDARRGASLRARGRPAARPAAPDARIARSTCTWGSRTSVRRPRPSTPCASRCRSSSGSRRTARSGSGRTRVCAARGTSSRARTPGARPAGCARHRGSRAAGRRDAHGGRPPRRDLSLVGPARCTRGTARSSCARWTRSPRSSTPGRSPPSCGRWSSRPRTGPDPLDVPSEALDWASFRAARDGTDAIVLDGEVTRPLADVAREAVRRVRPIARELGGRGRARRHREGPRGERRSPSVRSLRTRRNAGPPPHARGRDGADAGGRAANLTLPRGTTNARRRAAGDNGAVKDVVDVILRDGSTLRLRPPTARRRRRDRSGSSARSRSRASTCGSTASHARAAARRAGPRARLARAWRAARLARRRRRRAGRRARELRAAPRPDRCGGRVRRRRRATSSAGSARASSSSWRCARRRPRDRAVRRRGESRTTGRCSASSRPLGFELTRELAGRRGRGDLPDRRDGAVRRSVSPRATTSRSPRRSGRSSSRESSRSSAPRAGAARSAASSSATSSRRLRGRRLPRQPRGRSGRRRTRLQVDRGCPGSRSTWP